MRPETRAGNGVPATPRALGYRMPAEWEPQQAVWLSWPHDPLTFPDRVPEVERIYERAIETLARTVRVELLVKDRDTRERVDSWATRSGVRNLRLHLIPTADVWIRDYGPTFVKCPRGLAMVDWLFNAWGDKYPTLKPDGVTPRLLEPILGIPRFEPGIVMEGGGIEVNGAGVVLTTEQCLLNPNRNPHLSREAIETFLCGYLGCEKVLWLGEGIVGDDTDGHVDDVARFVSPSTVVGCLEDDPDDENAPILRANWEMLGRMADLRGRPLQRVALPMPGRVDDDESERLPASYANFLIANGVVLLPVFGSVNDERARSVLQKVFPDRKVVAIDCEPMVHGMGTLHCASQQMPASSLGP